MFGIGLPELIVILALALIVLGPEKLPQVARQAARLINELKRASDEFKKELELDKLDDIRKPIKLDKVLGEDLSELVQKKNLVEPDFLKTDSEKSGPGGLGPEWQEAQGPAASKEKSLDSGSEDMADKKSQDPEKQGEDRVKGPESPNAGG
ncbi:MAG: twin-arginine translocase subunit TatB [Thermodesulfatator sp.]|nr:MAG: twin-arginine translocase subunit TatB [Thermodesulfatator sp.]